MKKSKPMPGKRNSSILDFRLLKAMPSHTDKTAYFGKEKENNPTHPLKDFFICLDTVEELARKYRGVYKLHLRGLYDCNSKWCSYTRCANSKDLESALLQWEALLNKRSRTEPIIRVENLVDDCLPPIGFEYVLENVVSCDLDNMFNEEYSIGCSCKRCTPKVR